MKAYLIGNIRYFVNRIVFIIVLALVLLLAYFFYVPSIQLFGYELVNPFYDNLMYLSWWLHMMAFVTIVSTVISIVFLFASFYFNIKMQRREEKEKEYELRFTKKLVAYLYSDFLLDRVKKEDYYRYFKKLANSRMASEIFFRIVVRISKLIDEDFRMKLTDLLDNTGLRNRIEYSLYSNNTSEKIIALKVIAYMGVKGYDKKISKYINSRITALRNEAIITYVKLSETNNLDFLRDQKYHISKLGLNSIINAVHSNLKEDKIDYDDMLKSDSSRINVAGVMLVKDRSKAEYKEMIKTAINKDDTLLNEVAWDVYTTLGKTEADLKFLTSRFDKESHENKVNIMKCLRDFDQNEELLEFLDKVIKNESVLIKIYALRLLFEKNMNRLFTYQNMKDERIAIACREVADFNIS